MYDKTVHRSEQQTVIKMFTQLTLLNIQIHFTFKDIYML